MTQTIKKISKSEQAKRVAFKLILSAVFSAFGLYIFFTAAVITTAVNSEQKLREISTLERQNMELDKKYLTLVSGLDMDYAYTNGFEDKSEKVIYINRHNSLTSR